MMEVIKMNKVEIRLHFVTSCSDGCCSCGPDKNMLAFEKLAKKLVEKFGEEKLEFEAFNSLNQKKFPFLKDAESPVVSVGSKVVASGGMPSSVVLEKEISSVLKVA